MWPDLFGPGWVWGFLLAACLFAIFLALVWVFGDFQVPRKAADPIREIWHQYEQGELTRQEFERAKQAWAAPGYAGESPAGEPGIPKVDFEKAHIGVGVRVP